MKYEKSYFYIKEVKFFKVTILFSCFTIFIVGNEKGMFINYPLKIADLKERYINKVYGTSKNIEDFNRFLNSPLVNVEEHKTIFKGMLVKDALLAIS